MIRTNLVLEGVRATACRQALITAAVVVAALSSSGCGSIPDAEVSYYKAASKVTVRVVRTVVCDSKDYLYVANTVTPTVTHFADTKSGQTLRLAGLRGTFTDSDVKFEVYEDGRLKSVNTTITGQGEAVLKAATTLASTLAAFAGPIPPPSTYQKECAFVKDFGGGKPVTVAYESEVDPTAPERQTINPDASSKGSEKILGGALGGVCAKASRKEPPPPKPVVYTRSDGDLVLHARQPAWIQIEVGVETPGNGCTASLWTGRVLIAQLGTDYVLPVPRTTLFGKQVLAVGFNESGAIANVQYVSNSGAANAVGAANSLLTIAQGETTVAKVAEVRAEADLIAQQQRLAQCMADPKNCK
ncbi:hypothetical protein C7T35_34490 [Variovorax sp. WS11]|uniref:hypothetical protein n=1 Tax=Variovorax sp. WS11 TaxID=1105204 RepID=UPI000D0DBF27|nr:hypothetical protein [Variovorax sp. WS11]NDZ17790.1 hypothetical protein [Variovorax sp. WS11]PSL80033.1 hypothetical protein C7T35_34490 [Variovorax sp. WS11]